MLTTLTVPYADTSAAALQWSASLPDVAALDVLALRPSCGGAVRLELRLLGASHCAVLDVGAHQLAETVAGPAYGGAGAPLSRRHERTVGPLRYCFTSRVDRLEPEALGALAARLCAGVRGRGDRLAGVFPGAADALTVLHGAATARRARWSTWHLYPNTGEAVRTATAVGW